MNAKHDRIEEKDINIDKLIEEGLGQHAKLQEEADMQAVKFRNQGKAFDLTL